MLLEVAGAKSERVVKQLPWISASGALLCLGLLVAGAAHAQEGPIDVGGDRFISMSSVDTSAGSTRDMFAAGFSTRVSARVEGDLHAIGFDVELDGPVGADLYAAGFSVEIDAPVGSDLTASAGDLELRSGAEVEGNARITAGSARLDGPIAGSLMATAGSLQLNGTIAGDAHLAAGAIAFGKEARIGGTLTYSAPKPIDIPSSVVPSERVRYEKLLPGMMDEMRSRLHEPFREIWPSILSVLAFFVLTIAFLVLVAAIAHAFAPRTTDTLRAQTVRHPFRSILLGGLGLSMLIGLIPVSAMTLVGIPLIPIVVLSILVVWVVGYLLGVHALTWSIAHAFSSAPTRPLGQLFRLTIGLICLALLNFIPFLGWLANLTVIFLGLGALMQYGAERVSRAPSETAPGEPT
ncbi:hypothetical protein D5400_11975 [Georhizobium profundi]|uniref:DUF8173 domain-containing protein n=2 Tax=Georhizobium profundi TaxID=2341112 RepID=A0A3S9B4P3_9HYPH|nr:hypothetical protein D5400_11975 [Georhizobium profundi]